MSANIKLPIQPQFLKLGTDTLIPRWMANKCMNNCPSTFPLSRGWQASLNLLMGSKLQPPPNKIRGEGSIRRRFSMLKFDWLPSSN
jgi:hypothetical protein